MDSRPVKRTLCREDTCRDVCRRAGLGVVAVEHPLATDLDEVEWKSELTTPPWAIYIFRRKV